MNRIESILARIMKRFHKPEPNDDRLIDRLEAALNDDEILNQWWKERKDYHREKMLTSKQEALKR